MASEEWKIIFESTSGDGGGSSEGGEEAGGSKGTAETPQQRKQLVEDATKVFGAVAGVSGILAMVIKGMRDSIIFSTAFNSIMMIISAIADVFLIAFWPLVMVVIQALLNFIPIAAAVGKALAPLIEKIAQGLNTWLATGDPNQFIDASVDFITSIAASVGEWFAANGGKIITGIEKALVGFFTVIGHMQPVFDAIGKMFEGMRPAMTILAKWLGDNFIEPLIKYLVEALIMGVLRLFGMIGSIAVLGLGQFFSDLWKWVSGKGWPSQAESKMEMDKNMAYFRSEIEKATVPSPLQFGTAAFPAEAMARATNAAIAAQNENTIATRENTEARKTTPVVSSGLNPNAQLTGPGANAAYISNRQLSWGGV